MPGGGVVRGSNAGDTNGGARGMLFSEVGNTGEGTDEGSGGFALNNPGGFASSLIDSPGLPAYGSAGNGLAVAGEPYPADLRSGDSSANEFAAITPTINNPKMNRAMIMLLLEKPYAIPGRGQKGLNFWGKQPLKPQAMLPYTVRLITVETNYFWRGETSAIHH